MAGPLALDGDELVRRLAGGEGLQLELKRGLPGDEKVARTLAAFANTRGGLLVVGVDDIGTLVGAPRPAESAAALERIARERVAPPLDPCIGVVELGLHRLVVCLVGRAPVLHAARLDDGPLEVTVRTGSRTRAATPAALRGAPGGPEERPLDELERAALAAAARSGPLTAAALATRASVSPRRAALVLAGLERRGHLFGSGATAERRYARP